MQRFGDASSSGAKRPKSTASRSITATIGARTCTLVLVLARAEPFAIVVALQRSQEREGFRGEAVACMGAGSRLEADGWLPPSGGRRSRRNRPEPRPGELAGLHQTVVDREQPRELRLPRRRWRRARTGVRWPRSRRCRARGRRCRPSGSTTRPGQVRSWTQRNIPNFCAAAASSIAWRLPLARLQRDAACSPSCVRAAATPDRSAPRLRRSDTASPPRASRCRDPFRDPWPSAARCRGCG